MKTLSKTNRGLKCELIFPFKVVGKLSLAFQIPNVKCSHALWNWRRVTDVDFYMWFSGYGKWQTYSIGTFKFYCRLNHLVTFGWLSVKHLHGELDLEQWGSAAASLRAPLAWPRRAQRWWTGGPCDTPHFCLPSAGVAQLLLSWQPLFLPLLLSSLPRRRGQEKPQRWDGERGSGAVCQLGGRLSWKLLPMEGCLLLSSPFLPPLMQEFWLNVLQFAFWMLKSVCEKCFNTPSGEMPF